MVPPTAQATPTRRFRFLRCLGWGGFGVVYLAEMASSSGFEKKVAVKVLKADVVDRERVARRLRDEGRLLGLLQHPAIVRADDLVQLAGQPAVVMEYVPGANLSLLIDRRFCSTMLPVSVVIYIVRRVASALDAAFHSPSPATGEPLRVLHRDIKPSNIRVTPHGEVKILDFGIAHSGHHARESLTKDYQLGSMPYMAPEVMGGGKASAASDVYSLGVVLYELLNRGRLGWAGEVQAAHEAQIGTAMERLELDSCDKAERAELRALLEGMLNFDPDTRPAAAEVEQRCRVLERRISGPSLEDWVHVALPSLRLPELEGTAPLVGHELTEEHTDTTVGTSGDAAVTTVRLPPGPTDHGSEPSTISESNSAAVASPGRRGPLLGLALGLLLVAGIVAVVASGLHGSEPDTEPPSPTARASSVEPATHRGVKPQPPVPEPRDRPESRNDSLPQPVQASASKVTAPEPIVPRPAPITPAATHSSDEPEPTPVPEPDPEPVEVRIGSRPFGLAVFLDERPLGETPQVLQVEPGPHVLRFEDGEHRFEASIQVASDQENRWTYDRANDELR